MRGPNRYVAASCSLWLLLSAWAASRSSAQLVSIDLRDVTMADVARELERQTGFRFRLTEASSAPSQVTAERKLESLKAEGKPLKEVLRMACEGAGYKYTRPLRDLFLIEPGQLPAKPLATRMGEWEIWVKAIACTGRRSTIDFTRGYEVESVASAGLDVTLAAEADTDDAAARLCYLGDITITDDQGKEAFAERSESVRSGFGPFRSGYGAEEKTFRFEPPCPDATRLVSLLGVLSVLRRAETADFRFDDLSASGTSRTTAGAEVVFETTDYASQRSSAPANYTHFRCAVAITLRGVSLSGPRGAPDNWVYDRAFFVDKAGKEYNADRVGVSPAAGVLSGRFGFSVPARAELSAFVCRLARKSYEVREFIVRDVPLP